MEGRKNHIDIDFSVIKTLAYFDVFQYPLRLEEIFRFSEVPGICVSTVQQSLERLIVNGRVFRLDKFYSLQANHNLVTNRLRANKEADKWLPIARQKADLIFKFPFVRSVMASGSLSKNCMDENSDLDFFIITAKNRLWITRLMLTLYKKIFLRNSHKFFCINYYLSEDHLHLEDRNLFTATELMTLIPLVGTQFYDQLQYENSTWTSTFLPNMKVVDTKNGSMEVPSPKRLMEKFISVIPAHFLENLIMGITHRRWRRLYESSMGANEFQRAFRSTPYTAKAHPRNFQKKVLDQYAERLKQYLQPEEQLV